ncbi:MAG: glycoside hydrolase family 17 protein [Gammaproteobacteria bacterium]
MIITRFILFVLLAVAVNGLLAWLSNLPQDVGPDIPEGKIGSVSFAPFREGQSPLTAVFPTQEQIDADLHMLADETRAVRTYASLGGLRDVPAMAQRHGLKVIQGAWLGYNDTMQLENHAEVQQLIRAANAYPDVIRRVIVGNEVLLRGEMSADELIAYIRQVKQAVKQPVSYADVWSLYMQHPEVAQEVDFITVHILPYWEDEPLTIEQAARHIEHIYEKIHNAFPDKPIFIGESGWPSSGRQRGGALPSVVNAAAFNRALVQVATKHRFDYNIVEAFNQPWKSKLEGVVGANWGLYSVQRQPVYPLIGRVTENPRWPQRVLCAGLLTMFAVACFIRRCRRLSPLRLAAFIGFTQLFVALLVKQAGDLWYTSYSDLERLHTVIVVCFSTALAILLLRRALDVLCEQISAAALSLGLQYLYLAFIALAVYKALALGLNGRYLSIPYPLTYMPVAGVFGLTIIRYFTERQGLKKALDFNGLIGIAPDTRCSAGQWAIYGLMFLAGVLIVAETFIVAANPDFSAAYPLLSDRIRAAIVYTATQSRLLGWAMLIAAVVCLLPRKMIACLLWLMVVAVVYGETYAFTAGYDFAAAHPQFGARVRVAFIYTLMNTQMLLWLASLIMLAVPLSLNAEKKSP